ncbi:polyamine aminopropyltransferase [Oceanicaulis alexandrii]|uniref:polyamine aminopropyltransferase n=1 Tax=Oceanicaulis alexandrii TaxID=153233 RepID=UPI0003B36862|nr:polyamine aminopropyltransferase [Oceanicaulis alexandrii]
MTDTAKHTYRDANGDLWFRESLSEGIGNGLRIDKLLYAEASDVQDLIVFENNENGRVLAIDGLVQVSMADEFIYHEMVSHVPLLSHGAVKRVLIVGGGDGGAMREMLKHKGVESITLVEIDPDVIEFSKKWFPDVSQGSFEDPRVNVVIADGSKYVEETTDTFDLILIDSSDPVGPSAVLFTREFYTACSKLLNEGGVIVTQSGLAAIHPEPVKSTSDSFKALFEHSGFYLICVPAFSGGFMALGFATNDGATFDRDIVTIRERFAALNIKTKYYSPEIHKGSFALPPYIAEKIA